MKRMTQRLSVDLDSVIKSAKGEMVAGHKYLRREPKAGGGFKYVYRNAQGKEFYGGAPTTEAPTTKEKPVGNKPSKLIIVKSSPVLMAKNKAGAIKYWRLHIVRDGDRFFAQTSWCQDLAGGGRSEEQFSEPYYSEPKHVGMANERDSEAQAMFEFDAILKKQKDAGYREAGEKAAVRYKPMLAHKFKDSAHHAVWPSFVQPKLNGVRMLMDGKTAWTRGGKDHIPEVVKHLMFDTQGHVLDGELLMPGNILLQNSMPNISKYRAGSSELLYHVYDVVEPGVPYSERKELVKRLLKNAPPNVRAVQTEICQTESDVMGFHKLFTSQGYEGAMLRNPNTGYEDGKRSYSLLKVKSFVDAEFKIVDVVDGGGADAGHAIFVCDNGSGKRFNCRPEGSKANRAQMFKDRAKLIGKRLTVRYFEMSKDSIPLFPVGVVVREAGF